MIEAQEKEIDGNNYRFTPLMAKKARDLLIQLMNKLGPSVGNALKEVKNAGTFDADDERGMLAMLPAMSGTIGEALSGLLGTLSPAFYNQLIDAFFKNVQMSFDGGWKIVNSDFREIHFATNLFTEMKVLLWCLEVQYGDFFGLLRKASASLAYSRMETKASPLNSEQAQTGFSTE